MQANLRAALGALVIATSVSGCASKLPRERKVGGGALELRADLAAIRFTDLDSGLEVNLEQYMEEHNRQHLLLMFGSRGCAVCTKKSAQLRDEYLPTHFLFNSEGRERFELVGVNTDPEHAKPQVLRYRDGSQFGFIRWSDPRGDMLRRYFIKAGDPLGVPFTVLLSRAGIVWRMDNDDGASVDQILSRVAKSIGVSGDANPATPPPDGEQPSTTPNPGDTDVPPQPLPRRGLDRFKGIMVKSCADGTDQSLMDLAQMTRVGHVRFVQLAHGACDELCRENHRRMLASCAAGDKCDAITLAAAAGGACAAGIYRGGDELRSQFLSHFDWAYTPVVGDDGFSLKLPAPSKPWVLGFDDAGKLVFSKEGVLEDETLQAAMQAPSFGTVARGPDFRLYSKELGEQQFADLRRTADYTVLVTFEKLCDSCREELTAWSREGHLADYCSARQDACRVIALETTLPFDGSLASHVDEIRQTIAATGNRLPLYLDPVPYGDDNNGYVNRIFDGYLTARYPHWESLYGTVIYDKEGTIVADFKGGTPHMGDKVLERVQALTSSRATP